MNDYDDYPYVMKSVPDKDPPQQQLPATDNDVSPQSIVFVVIFILTVLGFNEMLPDTKTMMAKIVWFVHIIIALVISYYAAKHYTIPIFIILLTAGILSLLFNI